MFTEHLSSWGESVNPWRGVLLYNSPFLTVQIDAITKRIADNGYAVSFNPSAWLKVSDQTFRTHLASPSACIMPTSTVIASSECTHSKTYCQLSGIIKASAGASVYLITDQV